MSVTLEWPAIVFIAGVIITLIGVIYRIYTNNVEAQWVKIDQKASAQNLQDAVSQLDRAIDQVRVDAIERTRDVQKDLITRLQDHATRQDREVDALKGEMSRMTHSLAELRRDVAQGNIDIITRINDLALSLRSRPPGP